MVANSRDYEVIIIGGGPAGLTAGLYTSRARLKSLLLERGGVGGQIANTDLVENFPGFPDGISGLELSQLMHRQATKFGLEIIFAEATGIELKEARKIVKTAQGDFTAKAVIIASGLERQKLGVPGEEEFSGRGVSYCATCDGPLFKGKPVAVAGGGDAAITEALHLAKFASKVTVIHRRHQLRATRILQERAFSEPKIEFLWDGAVEQVEGVDTVKRLVVRNIPTGEKSTLDVAGIFVAIGVRAAPVDGYLKGALALDASGYIITNEKMETRVPGVFAAGDIRSNSAQQAITSAGDGATAAINAEKFILENS